jgi:hypothetical protein
VSLRTAKWIGFFSFFIKVSQVGSALCSVKTLGEYAAPQGLVASLAVTIGRVGQCCAAVTSNPLATPAAHGACRVGRGTSI